MPYTRYRKKVKNGNSYYFYRLKHKRLRAPKDIYGKTVKELNQKIDDLKEKLNAGTILDKTTFGDGMEEWLKEVKLSDRKESTSTKYLGTFNKHIKNYPICNIRIYDLKITDVQLHYDMLVEKGASKSIIETVNTIISSFVKYMFSRGRITTDFSDSIVVPQAKVKKVRNNTRPSRALTLQEQDALEKAIKNTKWESLILTDLNTGLRLGEILALTWKDVNLKEGSIKVNKTYNEKAKKDKITTAKTKTSIRKVPIPPDIVKILKKHKADQNERKELLGNKYIDNNLVFDNGYGKYISKTTLKRALDSFAKDTNLKSLSETYGVHFHDFRDTFATRLFAKTKNIKLCQVLLGHSDLNTTANIYTEVHYDESLNDLYKD